MADGERQPGVLRDEVPVGSHERLVDGDDDDVGRSGDIGEIGVDERRQPIERDAVQRLVVRDVDEVADGRVLSDPGIHVGDLDQVTEAAVGEHSTGSG